MKCREENTRVSEAELTDRPDCPQCGQKKTSAACHASNIFFYLGSFLDKNAFLRGRLQI